MQTSQRQHVEAPAQGVGARMMEAELYPYVQNWIDSPQFALARGTGLVQSDRKSVITAKLDWIDGGGWMRPDLALIHVRRRRYDPVPTLDLYTFEVKPDTTAPMPLSSVHQTLAHARFADFVLLVCPVGLAERDEVIQQAVRFGVGLASFDDPKRWGSYKLVQPPARQSPDPDLRDSFLTKALEPDGAEDVLGWISKGAGA